MAACRCHRTADKMGCWTWLRTGNLPGSGGWMPSADWLPLASSTSPACCWTKPGRKRRQREGKMRWIKEQRVMSALLSLIYVKRENSVWVNASVCVVCETWCFHMDKVHAGLDKLPDGAHRGGSTSVKGRFVLSPWEHVCVCVCQI